MARPKKKTRRKKKIRVEIPEFITHVPVSRTKFRKINGQALYSGMNPHIRAKIMKELHNYLKQYISKRWKLQPPVTVRLEFHAPINFGTVRRRVDKKTGKAVISWKEPAGGYSPKWDADNQWIWTKAFNDMLVEQGILPDDNVSVISASGEVKWVSVDHFDDRKLVFVIEEV